MSERERESTGFLIKQRAFLKVYLITEIERGPAYGLQLLEILQKKFDPHGFEPNHAEIYRSLHELTEAGILNVRDELAEGAKRKKLQVYTVKDRDLAKAYKELAKVDLDRCQDLLRKAIQDNYS